MTDFMVRMFTVYPWMAPLTIVLAVAGLAWLAVWVAGLSAFASDWIAYRRAVLGYKTAVRRRLAAAPCAVCELAEEGLDDPPEYQHPDGDEDWPPEPDEDAVESFLAALKQMGILNDDDQLPAEGVIVPRCEDPECDKYGWVHPPPCLILPTMPVAVYRDGPAMPPQPWSGLESSLEVLARGDDSPTLTGIVAAELGHDTTEAAVDSMFTRAQAREVEAMITDGVITPE